MKQLRINFIDLFLIFAFSLFLKQDTFAVDTWNQYANFKKERTSTGCFRNVGTKVTGLAELVKKDEESFNKQ